MQFCSHSEKITLVDTAYLFQNINDNNYISAEFIISIANKNNNFDDFKKVLTENGAEFEVNMKLKLSLFYIPFPLVDASAADNF